MARPDWALWPTPLNRTLCPNLRGEVHFDLSAANHQAMRGLVTDDEICHHFVNVAGLVACTNDRRSPSFSSPWASSVRSILRKMCMANFETESESCMHALAATATCGAHAHCTSARFFVANLLGADNPLAWGRPANPSASSVSWAPTLELLAQRQRGMLRVPFGARGGSGSAEEPSEADASGTNLPTVSLADRFRLHGMTQRAPPSPINEPGISETGLTLSANKLVESKSKGQSVSTLDGPSHLNDGHLLVAGPQESSTLPRDFDSVEKAHLDTLTAPGRDSTVGDEHAPNRAKLDRCSEQLDTAIQDSTPTMEDFILRSRSSSHTAPKSLRMLYSALLCCKGPMKPGPTKLSKAWYRFGFLLRRHASLEAAAEVALHHAISLSPETAGPPNAELLLLKLDNWTLNPIPAGTGVHDTMRQVRELPVMRYLLGSHL